MGEELFIEGDDAEPRTLVAGAEDAGQRLDALLASHFEDLSRSRIQSLIESGNVTISSNNNDAGISSVATAKNQRVRAGDRICILVKPLIPLQAAPEDIPIDVVYEDADVIVVNKARGMVVHPGKGNASGTLVNALLHHGAIAPGQDPVRPGVVHRIDKNTSGLLVFAKNARAHEGLAAQFAAHAAQRLYHGIAVGGFDEDAGTVDAPIGRSPSDRQRMAVVPGGKPAVTHWRVLERFSDAPGRQRAGAYGGKHTYLELRLETGRTHQIRVHLAYIGRPVMGDDLYGGLGGEGQILHAKTLGFTQPVTGKRLLFDSELPGYFSEVLGRLRG